jgi:hypothetical protein
MPYDEGMTKLIYSGVLPQELGFSMEIVEDGVRFQKMAATIGDVNYEALSPDSDHVGIHLIALGEVERYGFNRNGDGFPKVACVNYHGTFVKNGHVYRHHQNKDPEKRLGDIKMSAYEEPMGRIELFIHAHKERAKPELEKLEKTGEIPFSMACRVQHDRCSICNNIRKSSKDPATCDHVRHELGKVAEDGRVTGTYNDEPNFFDISFVYRPADRIAWHLKVASAGTMDSVKLAEEAGVWTPESVAILSTTARAKHELLHKIASMEQHFFGLAQKPLHLMSDRERELWELRKSAAVDQTLSDATINELRAYDMDDALYHMAADGVVLDVPSFFKYATGDEYGHIAEYVDRVNAAFGNGFFSQLEKAGNAAAVCNDGFFDVDVDPFRAMSFRSPRSLVAGVRSAASFADKYASHRAVLATIEGRPAEIVQNEAFWTEKQADGVVKDLAERYASYKLAAVLAWQALNPEQDSERQLASVTAQHLIKR